VVRTATEVATTSEVAAVDDLPGIPVADGFELSIGVTQVGAQKFEIDGTIFTSLREGTLLKENFETAARADDKDDFIMYKWKTGELFYDADGRGAIGQIKIGQLDAQMSLDHTDFVVSGTAAPLTVEIAKSPDKELVLLDIVPTGGNHETILGFDPDADQFVLDSSVFKALRGNQGEELAATHFEVAARADDIDDFIMYKWKTGELFYDPDGRGRESQIKIAQLDDRMSLDHSDFLIV
jgi:Ca2+-binding RTX toxin-like protein